jgi:ArsR family transcriptional regulator
MEIIAEVKMDIDFAKGSTLLKAISDPTRIRIVHILSCGELCACELQEYFDLTQPTLSHHLGVLKAAGIVTSRQDGKWIHYGIDREVAEYVTDFLGTVFFSGDRCLCHKTGIDDRAGCTGK